VLTTYTTRSDFQTCRQKKFQDSWSVEEEGLLESVGETGRHHEAQLDGVSSMHSVEPRRAPAARFFSDGEPIP